jgi:uncharacterized membrane protein
MAQLLRCRSCGYVIEESKAGDVCPACGVPRKMLEPWTDPVSEKRRKLLKFDIHPILVHYPVAFTVTALVACLFSLVFPEVLRQGVTALLRALLAALPLVTAVAFCAGLLDGKIRFRKVTTPLLVRKIILGCVLFASTLAACLLTFLVGPYVPWVRIADALLLAAGLGAATGLGLIGSGLVHALFPG